MSRVLEMTDPKLLTEYACLLRWAWLNPSHRPAQDGVREFERQHVEELEPLWTQWQDEPKNRARFDFSTDPLVNGLRSLMELSLKPSNHLVAMSDSQRTRLRSVLIELGKTHFGRY